MKYERDLQVRLRERYRRLYKTDYDVYGRQANYFRDYLLGVPALKAVLSAIERGDPDLDPDKWMETNFHNQTYDFPETESGQMKVAWRLLRRIADGESDILHVSKSFSSERNVHASARDVTEKAFEPLVEYLEERIGSESEILYLLERLKRRIEAFDREDLYEKYVADSKRGEALYDRYIRRFLFDEGVDNPFSQPRSASGDVDIVADLDNDDPLVQETKLYDGGSYSVPYVAKGFNQAIQYAQDYGKVAAHLVILNLSDHNLQLPSDSEAGIWPPRLEVSGVTVYLVAIRAKPLPSASRMGKQTTKSVTRENLVRPEG